MSTSSSRAKTTTDLLGLRLAGHGLAGGAWPTPVDVVRALGAVQAQDYLASQWAVGLRAGGDLAAVEAAHQGCAVVRTHALRNTIHLVAREDVRWMLALTAERLWKQAQPRYRELGLDGKTLAKAERVFAKQLAGGGALSRAELGAALTAAGVGVGGQRMPHLLHHGELRGLLVGQGRDFTWLERAVPAGEVLPRDAAAARLARRYFAHRGPASADDFAWWSGLPAGEARAAVAAVAGELVTDGTYYWAAREPVRVAAQLLPAFDEYTVAYRDRAALRPPRCPLTGFQLLSPVVVVDGRVVATWKRERGKGKVAIAIAPVVAVTRAQRAAIEAAAARYGEFLGLLPSVRFAALR